MNPEEVGQEPVEEQPNALEGMDAGEEVDAQEGVEYEAEQPAPEAPARNFEEEQEARKYGWRPKDEYTNDPKGWVDADRFLKLPSTDNKRLRDELKAERREFDQRMQNMERMSKMALERQKQQHEAQIESVSQAQRAAAETADVAEYDRLEKQKQALMQQQVDIQPEAPKGPDPVVSDYMARNDWTRNPVLWQQAVDIVGANAAQIGPDPSRQIAFAEAEMRKMYPAMFPDATPAPAPAKARPQRVDGGGLAQGRGKSGGASRLPPEALAAAKSFVSDGIYKSIDEYAKDYFEEGN